MKKALLVVATMVATNAFAVKLSDYKPFNFEALFTNPVCETYKYDQPLTTNSGKTVTSKPQNVYCKPSDETASVSRSTSPQYRIREWISSPETKELYIAYLSFDSKNIAASLCDAVKRGVKINMVLDQGEDKKINKLAESLKTCSEKADVTVTYRGSTGGLGFAHNKIMVVNPGAPVVKIVFSSGNLTGGTSINHENWNFVTTSGESYFAGSHKCVVEAMISGGEERAKFTKDLNDCRAKIKAAPESDIKTYFSPVDGKNALAQITEAGNRAVEVSAMSHRFSGAMAKLFSDLLVSGKPIKFILDDDIYWAEHLKKDVGRNTKIEAFKITNELIRKGMNTKFLQTNQNVFQLQHNKFVVLKFADGSGAVYNGAGNFTTAAYEKNFENFYYIEIPGVVDAYRTQYNKYFDEMATSADDMTRDYVLP